MTYYKKQAYPLIAQNGTATARKGVRVYVTIGRDVKSLRRQI